MSTRHLSQVELAQRWSISPRTLERWRWTGEGPVFLKLGGRVVYRLQDVEAYELDNRCASTASQQSMQHLGCRPGPAVTTAP